MGDPNASIPTPQPVHYRPMFAAFGGAVAATSSPSSPGGGTRTMCGSYLGLAKRCVPVAGTREVGKSGMKLNDYQPHIEVDPQTYEVRADGERLHCEPADGLPLAQRYFLF